MLTILGTWSAARQCDAEPTYTVQKVWSDQLYNAFTDLTVFDNHLYLAFRDAVGHGIPNPGYGGKIRVMESDDGSAWTSTALLSDTWDLRDPKLTVTPDNRLSLVAGALPSNYPDPTQPLKTMAWFSGDGSNWTTPQTIGDPDFWLWRTEWHNGTDYAVGYGPNSIVGQKNFLRLYTSTDGTQFQTLSSRIDDTPPNMDINEAGLAFLKDGTALMVARRDGGCSVLGTSSGDYSNWNFTNTINIHSPDLLQLDDGRIIAAGRLFDESGMYTGLCWVDPSTRTLTPFLHLPSGPGDTGYPGMVWKDNTLWVSYYSASGGTSDIYVAKVDMPLQVPEPTTFALLLSATVGGFVIMRRKSRSKA